TTMESSNSQTPNSDKFRFRLWRDRKEVFNTLLAIIWFAFCTYVVCLANAYLDRTYPTSTNFSRLPDPLLEGLAPYYVNSGLAPDLADKLVKMAPLIIFLRPLLMGEHALLILRRQLFVIGTCYLVRTPFVLMTVLPNPLASCRSAPSTNLFYYALLLFAQVRSSCADVLFSGHTIMFAVAALSWSTYPVSLITTWLAWLFCSFGILVLIASTYHYTVDCVVGVLVVSLIWKLYHFIVTTHYVDHTLYAKALRYLDADPICPNFGYELCYDSEYP
ncbi:hypothetical protein L0F63_005198, partial [Massospora cicadina]